MLLCLARTVHNTHHASRALLTRARLGTLVSEEWNDVFRIRKALNPDEESLLRSTEQFSRDYLAKRLPGDFTHEITEKGARDVIREFGKLGALGATVGTHGCLGVDSKVYGLMAKAVESIDSGYRSAFSVQTSLVMSPISEFGSDNQKDKYLPGLASGTLVGCFGLTEPDHGSDPSNMATLAVRDGCDYILNGQKTWITNSPVADVLLVWAKDESGTVRGFLIDRDTSGLETPAIKNKQSLRASLTGSIFMENVRVPATQVLPNVAGFRGPFTCLSSARHGIAWGALGAAETCIRIALAYTKARVQFGEPLAAKQLVQLKLVNAMSAYNIALASCEQASRAMGAGQTSPDPIVVSMIKRNSCQTSLEIARSMRDLLGGNGVSDDYGIIRHVMNLEAVNTYEGTSDVHALILGKYMTGFSAF